MSRCIPRGAAAACLAAWIAGAPAPAVAEPVPAPAATAAAPRPPADALRLLWYWLDAQVGYEKLPGLTAAVVVGPDTVARFSFGTADHAGRQPMRPDTLFSICSISKVFTAIAVMQLWEDGKLSLDDDVTRWVPKMAVQRSDPDSGPVTIRALLMHASGLPREGAFLYWSERRFPSTDELLAATAGQRMLQRTGERYQYSNLGVALLGEVVAAASGMPYARYVEQKILAPLGLRDTAPALPAALWGQRLAQGFGALQRDGRREPMPLFDTAGLVPAAGFSSTAEDLARVLAWQNRLRRNGGREVLKVATLREMQRVQWADNDATNTWGYGFWVQRDGNKLTAGHNGTCPGYLTDMTLALDDEVGVALLINANDNRSATRLSTPARRLLVRGLRLPAAAADGPVLAEYSGRYGGSAFFSESVVVPWGRDLAWLTLPTTDPVAGLSVLRHAGGDTFRFVRDDGSLGGELRFVRDASGRVAAAINGASQVPRTAAMEERP
jgi:CubicO group peptidase (beta-lactamase class C family)